VAETVSKAMPKPVIVCLVIAVLISSLFVINVRHQHRVAYMTYQKQETERDALNDEWGQLLVEENVWASAHRVEKHAGERLSMRAPEKNEVQIIGQQLAEQLAGVESDSR
jgi:cell division protein FtsL